MVIRRHYYIDPQPLNVGVTMVFENEPELRYLPLVRIRQQMYKVIQDSGHITVVLRARSWSELHELEEQVKQEVIKSLREFRHEYSLLLRYKPNNRKETVEVDCE